MVTFELLPPSLAVDFEKFARHVKRSAKKEICTAIPVLRDAEFSAKAKAVLGLWKILYSINWKKNRPSKI